MKRQQQITISRPLHHRDSDDYFGLMRFVGLAIAILMFLTVTAFPVAADETAQDKSSATAERKAALPLLDGEWKLHSVTTVSGVLTAPSRDMPTGHIGNGNLVVNGEAIDLKVVNASGFKAEVRLTGPPGVPALATIDRLGDVIKMTVEELEEPTKPQAGSPSDELVLQAADKHEQKFSTFEFWKVDPNRSKTVLALRDLQVQVNTLRLEGRQEDIATIGKKIAELTGSLKRMDMSPKITSLTQQALQAREKGDHDRADKLEFEANKLSKQLLAEMNVAANQVQIFAATTPIKAGAVLNSSNSKLVAVDAASVPTGAVIDPANVWGQFSRTSRSTGDWILSESLLSDDPNVSSSIPEGYRVITVPIDAKTNHAGMLQPGNRIDLLLTIEEPDAESVQQVSRVVPLLEYIEVFAVGSNASTGTASAQTRSLSLIVTSEQAMKIQQAREKGKISTVLRSSQDKDLINPVAMEESELTTFDADKPSPFVGEWRLDSVEPESLQSAFFEDDPIFKDFEQFKSQVWVRNGILYSSGDEPIDLGKSAVRISDDKWEISLPGDSQGKCWARQFGTVLRLNFMGTGTDCVHEYWLVSPERKDVTQQLLRLNSQLSSSRAAGDAPKSMEVETSIARLNGRLHQLDVQPAVDSLTFMAIRAREKGDHVDAHNLEIDAKELARMQQKLVPDEPTDKSSGPVKQALERSALEEVRQALLSACETCEADTVSFAKEYRAAVAARPPENSKEAAAKQKKLTALEVKLKRSVALAFKAQGKLQDVKLQLAELDLADVRAKHKRRAGLAYKIIQRRIEQLKNDDPLSWNQVSAEQTKDKRSAEDSLPVFATPQELVAYFQDARSTDRWDECCNVLANDEVNRSAGIMLRVITAMQSVVNLAKALGANINDPEVGKTIGAVTKLEELLDRSLYENPTAAAIAAHKKICSPTLLWQSSAIVSAAEYSATLRAAAGMLIDPKRFLEESMPIMWEMEKPDEEAKADWRVTVTGDTARAENLNSARDPNSLVEPYNLELIKVAGTWQISSLTAAASIMKLQESGKPADDVNPAALAPAVIDLQYTHSSIEE